MAEATFGLPMRKRYGETVSLTTTAAHLLFMPGYHETLMYCASDFRVGIAPKLAACVFYSAVAGTYTDYTSQAVDRVSTTHVPLDAMIATDILYLGVKAPTRGFYINIGTGVNANAATLDVEYMSAVTAAGVATFTDVADDSDGTTSGGATLAVDGLYAFTLPAVVSGPIAGSTLLKQGLFWYRFKPSATLSATVDLVDIIPACDTVNYGYGFGGIAEQYSLNTKDCGAFEFDHAGTDTLYVNWIMH